MATLLSLDECTLLKGTGKTQDDGKNPCQRIFIAKFDSKPADFDEIILAAGVPRVGDSLKTGDGRLCKAVAPASMGTVTDFIITCDFEVPNPNSNTGNPLTRPDIVGLDFGVRQENYFKDCSDTPKYLINAAGEPFSELRKRDVGVFKFTVSGNRASIPATTWAGYLYPATAINNGAVTIKGIAFGAGILRLLGMRAAEKTSGTLTYLECEWTLAANPNGWDDELENRGFNELDTTANVLKPIFLDDSKTKPAHPWPLNTDGTKMANASDAPSTQTFKPYPKKDFGIFNWTAA